MRIFFSRTLAGVRPGHFFVKKCEISVQPFSIPTHPIDFKFWPQILTYILLWANEGFSLKINIFGEIGFFIFFENFRVVGVNLKAHISAKKIDIQNRLVSPEENICKNLWFKFEVNRISREWETLHRNLKTLIFRKLRKMRFYKKVVKCEYTCLFQSRFWGLSLALEPLKSRKRYCALPCLSLGQGWDRVFSEPVSAI